MVLQSILFDKQIWTYRTSRTWLKKHNIIPIKEAHDMNSYFRYRINEPCNKSSNTCHYYSIRLPDGIIFTFMKYSL